MDIRELLPILIYDDGCYHCSRFAGFIKSLAGKKMTIVGHYTDVGRKIKAEIFPPEYDATKMFWFVTGDVAYGGRAGVLPLVWSILTGPQRKNPHKDIPLVYGSDCRTPSAFFTRTKTLLSSSQRIPLAGHHSQGRG